MKPPPIGLFAYNRLSHTMRTIEALQKNYGACESILYIFSDGPRNDVDVKEVAEVRNYIKRVTGFADVIIIEREQNLGLSRSLTGGIGDVLDSHDSIIVLEDDLVTSPYFLQFMKDALTYYEYEEQVVAVHGYTFPLRIQLPETFFLRSTGCWGWGTWKRGWAIFEPDGRKLMEQLQNSHLTTRFDMNGAYPYTRMLEGQVRGEVDSWAIRWYASAFLSDKLNLYPGVSLVRNIGHDGSGEHSYNSSFYDVCLSDRRIEVHSIPLCEDTRAVNSMEAYFRRGHSGNINYWLWKLFGKG
jgi:hypothetical protein